MEKIGYVSLWVGNIKSEDELSKYVELIYTENCDWIQWLFAQQHVSLDDAVKDFNRPRTRMDHVVEAIDIKHQTTKVVQSKSRAKR